MNTLAHTYTQMTNVKRSMWSSHNIVVIITVIIIIIIIIIAGAKIAPHAF